LRNQSLRCARDAGYTDQGLGERQLSSKPGDDDMGRIRKLEELESEGNVHQYRVHLRVFAVLECARVSTNISEL
jgi:hypothetical protein